MLFRSEETGIRFFEDAARKAPVRGQTPREQLAEIVKNETGMAYTSKVAADRIISAGWRPPVQRITTLDELDSLSFPAIVREEPTDPTEFFPQIWEMGYQVGWCRVGHRFFDIDDCTPRLPVRVLHTPENGDTE